MWTLTSTCMSYLWDQLLPVAPTRYNINVSYLWDQLLPVAPNRSVNGGHVMVSSAPSFGRRWINVLLTGAFLSWQSCWRNTYFVRLQQRNALRKCTNWKSFANVYQLLALRGGKSQLKPGNLLKSIQVNGLLHDEEVLNGFWEQLNYI